MQFSIFKFEEKEILFSLWIIYPSVFYHIFFIVHKGKETICLEPFPCINFE